MKETMNHLSGIRLVNRKQWGYRYIFAEAAIFIIIAGLEPHKIHKTPFPGLSIDDIGENNNTHDFIRSYGVTLPWEYKLTIQQKEELAKAELNILIGKLLTLGYSETNIKEAMAFRDDECGITAKREALKYSMEQLIEDIIDRRWGEFPGEE
jgi:hypothetical protein